jgi:hypothetical protein
MMSKLGGFLLFFWVLRYDSWRCFQTSYGMPSIPAAVPFLHVRRALRVCSHVMERWRGMQGHLVFARVGLC